MRRRAGTLMLQGTGSHVGKTVLVAGLCRLLRDRGVRVAPFKAQNMALNAAVTPDGGEIGWAQAIQAEAAGLEPSVDMNPILLKPQTSPGGGAQAQVVVGGKVWATLRAAEYHQRRAELWPVVADAFARLAAAHDAIVIEGAGSPAEPNLLAVDLVNMSVARLARAPVVLVGDIDRGGVFASLLGTLAILSPADRWRVRGFLVNKFRGDPAILAPALAFLTRKTRRPVFGVLPLLGGLHLPEEDSVALDEAAVAGSRSAADRDGGGPTPGRRVRIAVVRLPHIANFADVAPLAADSRFELRWVTRAADLDGADLVLLPGSKDTLADLRWLHAEGLASAVTRQVAAGGRLGGICGGFQMLGVAVEDPEGLEGGGQACGLGLLPVTTTLGRDKVTRRVRARLAKTGVAFDAYEIHLGRTGSASRGDPAVPFAEVETGAGWRPDGAVSADGRVWGSYLHGLFDAAPVRAALLGELAGGPGPRTGASGGDGRAGAADAGPSGATGEDYRAVRERAYDRLAILLETHADVPALLDLLAGASR